MWDDGQQQALVIYPEQLETKRNSRIYFLANLSAELVDVTLVFGENGSNFSWLKVSNN